MTSRSMLILVMTALVVSSCSADGPTSCTRELRLTYSPHDTAIAVGDRFTASVALSSCGGRERLSDTITFQSSDTTVAGVGTQTGTIVGMRPGTASITASAAYYGVDIRIPVRVQ